MNEYPKISGIAGLEGREPVPVKAATGYRGGVRNHPKWKNRFHLLHATETDGWCDYHPAFSAFNYPGDVDGVDNKNPVKQKQYAQFQRRRILRGNLFHAYSSGCFLNHRKAYVLPDHQRPPGKRPTCIGNGELAIRYVDGGFKEIPCNGELCEFSQPMQDNKGRMVKYCGPFSKLLFRLRWQPSAETVDGQDVTTTNRMPSMMCSYASGGWGTARNMLGFIEQITSAAEQLGIRDPILFGLPFVMTFSEKTNAETRTRWPVISFSPECDLLEFFLNTRKQIEQLGTTPPEVPMLHTSDGSDAVLASDARELMMEVPRG